MSTNPSETASTAGLRPTSSFTCACSTTDPGGRLSHEIINKIVLLLPSVGGTYSNLTTVCQNWKAMLEPFNFSEITLTQQKLASPETHEYLWRRRHQIHYIWLRVDLCLYPCSMYTPLDENYDSCGYENDQRVASAFERLLNALSLWEPRGDLVLDTSVFSDSDNKHYFKYLDFRSDRDLNEPPPPSVHDPIHGWVEPGCHVSKPLITSDYDFGLANVHGQLISKPGTNSIRPLFDLIMDSNYFPSSLDEQEWWASLPLVPAVGTVLLRQQCRRRWRQETLFNMFDRFPNLLKICYEPWRQQVSGEPLSDRHNEALIISLLATNLRELTLFENFNEAASMMYVGTRATRPPSLETSRALAYLSLQLTKLSVSYAADAHLFFASRGTRWTWKSLTSITLTSDTLGDDTDTDMLQANDMLREAAKAAMRMPVLETMEVWNGRRGLAMLFRYERSEAAITLKGSLNFVVEPATRLAWDAVVLEHTTSNSRVKVYKQLIVVDVLGHGEVIRLLGLRGEVARPVSLQQMRRNDKYAW